MQHLTQEGINQLLGIVPPDKKAQIDAKVEESIKTLERKLDRKFTRPVVTYGLRGRTAGRAIGGRIIELNVDLLHGEYWDDMLNRTVPHEVAHIVQRQLYPLSKPHGAEWQYLMALLGLPADRTHSYKVESARKTKRFRYFCHCSNGCMVGANRHNKIQSGEKDFMCASCYCHLGSCDWTQIR